MEINEIIEKVKDQYGDKFSVEKIKASLHGVDHKNMSFAQIMEKIKGGLGDLDGDGKVESPFQEIKGKATAMFGGMFHKK